MKKLIITLILIMFYCIPYTYVGIIIEFIYRNALGYIMMLLFPIILSYMACKYDVMFCVVLGNILSFIVSYYLINYISNDRWNVYFKPFYPNTFAIIISLLNLVPQLIVIILYKKKCNLM